MGKMRRDVESKTKERGYEETYEARLITVHFYVEEQWNWKMGRTCEVFKD